MAVAEGVGRGTVTPARVSVVLAAALTLAATAAGAADATSAFSFRAFFAGSSVSAGEIRTVRFFAERFTARFEGHAEGDRLDLDERFAFEDGSRLQRWHLRERGGTLEGSVLTEGSDGAMQGPFPVAGKIGPQGAILSYRGIAPGGGRVQLDFRHEMTPNGDGTVTNHVRVSRFGIPLALADVTFAKSATALAGHVSRRPR